MKRVLIVVLALVCFLAGFWVGRAQRPSGRYQFIGSGWALDTATGNPVRVFTPISRPDFSAGNERVSP